MLLSERATNFPRLPGGPGLYALGEMDTQTVPHGAIYMQEHVRCSAKACIAIQMLISLRYMMQAAAPNRRNRLAITLDKHLAVRSSYCAVLPAILGRHTHGICGSRAAQVACQQAPYSGRGLSFIGLEAAGRSWLSSGLVGRERWDSALLALAASMPSCVASTVLPC
jgi:hypothetical protein